MRGMDAVVFIIAAFAVAGCTAPSPPSPKAPEGSLPTLRSYEACDVHYPDGFAQGCANDAVQAPVADLSSKFVCLGQVGDAAKGLRLYRSALGEAALQYYGFDDHARGRHFALARLGAKTYNWTQVGSDGFVRFPLSAAVGDVSLMVYSVNHYPHSVRYVELGHDRLEERWTLHADEAWVVHALRAQDGTVHYFPGWDLASSSNALANVTYRGSDFVQPFEVTIGLREHGTFATIPDPTCPFP